MADMFLDPIMEKIISAGLRYLKDQVRWQKRRKEELEKLRKNLPQIQAVVHFASSQEQITDQDQALNKWLWQLRDAIDDADDVLDDLEYMELEKQVTKNKKLRRVRSIMKSMKKRLVKIVKRALKIDPTLKRLEEAVQELYRVSTTGVETFLRLAEQAKQEHQKQQHELHGAREEGYLPKNDLIGRGKDKESVVQWLRNPSNEHRGTELYRNISLLSIVGHGGMGKTALLQHVYKDEITKEFDRQMWVCVSNNFDKKKVIADMLESLKKERTRLETLGELQGALEKEVMSKKFLLVLDDIWEEDEEKDKSKWEDVLAPLASGAFGSKILVTTRTDSVALMFAKVIKKVKTVKFKEDECLELLISHAFAGVENPHHHENLIVIAQDIVKKLSSSPWKAKVIGGTLNDNLDERHWRTVLESNLLDQNSNNSILRLSYTVLPKHLQNCFAFCCMFPKDHTLDKDDLVRMWIALGFIQPSQGMTLEDMGGRYFDVLVKKTLFDEVGDGYKMQDLIHESASKFFAEECGKLVDVEESSFKIPETLRHLSVQTTNLNILRKIEKFKHLRSLFLSYEDFNQDLCGALIEIFKALRCLRLLYIRTHKLEIIPEEIRYLKHLRYLKIVNVLSLDVTRLPRSLRPSGQLPFLKSLTHKPIVNWLKNKLNGNDKYPAFPLLEVLHISGFEALEDWFEAGVAAEDGCLFPSLIELELSQCPKLKELPSLPPKLKKLQIRSTGWKTLKFCSNSNPIPLEKLLVLHCRNITSLPLADEIARLAALRSLTIGDCPNLSTLGSHREVGTTNNCHLILNFLCISDPSVLLMEPLTSIASLKELSIWWNDKLVSFPNEAEQWFLNVSSSLCELHFMYLKSLESLPCSLESLSSLQKLSIIECSNLISLARYREVETTNNCQLMLNTLKISDPSVLLVEPLRSIASLKRLSIWKNDKLVSFPNEAEQWFLEDRSSLCELHFMYLKSLESLPSSLESLSSLHKLYIEDVPMLRELPNLPPSLKQLRFFGEYHPELKERYREDGGSDGHKIAHIPDIYFDK